MKKKHHVHMIPPSGDETIRCKTELPLTSALFVYGKDDNTLITRHAVKPDGSLSHPTLLDCVEFANTLLDLSAQQAVERLAFRPEHVLAHGRKSLVWWRPAQATPLWFKVNSSADSARYTALNGKPVPLPALVFKIGTGGLNVWALSDNRRPTPETKLMLAPFMNLMSSGHQVCLGSAQRPKSAKPMTAAELTAAWERVFFESNFSHTPPRMNYPKGETYIDVLEWLANGQADAVALHPASHCVFPANILSPSKATLSDALKS